MRLTSTYLSRFAKACSNILAGLLLIIGLAGLPSDLIQWSEWVGPYADYLGHDWARWLFVVTGLLLIGLAQLLPGFVRNVPLENGPLSALPSRGADGAYYVATDVKRTFQYRVNSGWIELKSQDNRIPEMKSQKASIVFGASGTSIDRSLNVSSVTDEGVGRYTISWGTNFPDDKYSLFVSVSGLLVEYECYPGYARLRFADKDGHPRDPDRVSVLASYPDRD